MATLRTISVGTPQPVDYATSLETSAIVKHAVTGPVTVHALGLEGDQVADTYHHGGPDKAVYVFAREDLDRWSEQLSVPLADGDFGENLTTSGIDVNEALVGERWQIGTALMEVASVRVPCRTFAGRLALLGLDQPGWIKRFTLDARPGPYLRVIEPGTITAGDAIDVVRRPEHSVTVSLMFRALTTERELLPHLLDVQDLTPQARAAAEAYVAQRNR